MTYYTHTTFGLLLTFLGLKIFRLPASLAVLSLQVLGALAPDLDGYESKIKHLKIPTSTKRRSPYIKPFLLLSEGLHFLFGHRSFMHSLLAVFILSGIALTLHHVYGGNILLYAAFVFGYLSHLLADSLTKSGIPLLYPYKRKIRLLPKSLTVRTGSWSEYIFFLLLALSLILWLKTNPQFLRELITS